jgi:hypothetical protein
MNKKFSETVLCMKYIQGYTQAFSDDWPYLHYAWADNSVQFI